MSSNQRWRPWQCWPGTKPMHCLRVEVFRSDGSKKEGTVDEIAWDLDARPNVVAYRVIEPEAVRKARELISAHEASAVAEDLLRLYEAGLLHDGYRGPEPEREPPNLSDRYWVPRLHAEEPCAELTWMWDDIDKRLLKRGYVYLNKEDAQERERMMRWEEE